MIDTVEADQTPAALLRQTAALLSGRSVSAFCVVEEDGYHLHRYVVDGAPSDGPRLVVEHDFHTSGAAYDEPTAPTVTSWYGERMIRRHDDLAKAVAAIADGGRVAELVCRVEAHRFPAAVARVLAALAEPLPADAAADWREHQAAGFLMRLTAAQMEADAHEQDEPVSGIYRARAGALRWQARLSLETAATFRMNEAPF